MKGRRRIKRIRLILGIALLTLATALAVNVIPSAAVDPPPPIASEPLTARSVFPDEVDMKLKLKEPGGGTAVIHVDDPSRTVDVRYTVQPGAQFPWHSHYGPVIVNIVSGSLTYVSADLCSGTTYSAGESAPTRHRIDVRDTLRSPAVFCSCAELEPGTTRRRRDGRRIGQEFRRRIPVRAPAAGRHDPRDPAGELPGIDRLQRSRPSDG